MSNTVNAHLYETKGGLFMLITERRDGTLGRVIASCPKGGTLKPGPEFLGKKIIITEVNNQRTRTGV